MKQLLTLLFIMAVMFTAHGSFYGDIGDVGHDWQVEYTISPSVDVNVVIEEGKSEYFTRDLTIEQILIVKSFRESPHLNSQVKNYLPSANTNNFYLGGYSIAYSCKLSKYLPSHLPRIKWPTADSKSRLCFGHASVK
jgi:hypothetical protein